MKSLILPRLIMRLLLLLPLVLLTYSIPAKADMVETTWFVDSFVGDPTFGDPKKILGQSQMFYKGSAKGVFYSCNYSGQTMTYNTYSLNEFLTNKEFDLFAKYKNQLFRIKNKPVTPSEVFVHRITCNGKDNPKKRRVLYPFVTLGDSEKWKKAFYLFEEAIYILKY